MYIYIVEDYDYGNYYVDALDETLKGISFHLPLLVFRILLTQMEISAIPNKERVDIRAIKITKYEEIGSLNFIFIIFCLPYGFVFVN